MVSGLIQLIPFLLSLRRGGGYWNMIREYVGNHIFDMRGKLDVLGMWLDVTSGRPDDFANRA